MLENVVVRVASFLMEVVHVELNSYIKYYLSDEGGEVVMLEELRTDFISELVEVFDYKEFAIFAPLNDVGVFVGFEDLVEFE